MRNAREEFEEHVKGNSRVLCVSIFYNSEEITLKINYSEIDYLKFLNDLDFLYDNGYGGQELYGTIWYEDGTWSERGEYDGSEWWEYKKCPIIPNKLYNEHP